MFSLFAISQKNCFSPWQIWWNTFCYVDGRPHLQPQAYFESTNFYEFKLLNRTLPYNSVSISSVSPCKANKLQQRSKRTIGLSSRTLSRTCSPVWISLSGLALRMFSTFLEDYWYVKIRIKAEFRKEIVNRICDRWFHSKPTNPPPNNPGSNLIIICKIPDRWLHFPVNILISLWELLRLNIWVT